MWAVFITPLLSDSLIQKSILHDIWFDIILRINISEQRYKYFEENEKIILSIKNEQANLNINRISSWHWTCKL